LLLFSFVVILFTCFLPQSAFCQETDSLPAPKPISQSIAYSLGIQESTKDNPLDTGLADVHYYDPVDRHDFLFRNTGALGSASFRMVCCEQPQMGFEMGYRQFDLFRFTKQNVPFYNNKRPFSRLDFLIGLKKEQTVNVVHSQNIGKKFNFGFHYMRYATTGLYTRQRTRHNDLAFSSTFDSKKRYLLKTIFILNNIRADENGGVKETNIFEDTSFVSKELVNIELENAENKQREITFHVYHSLNNQDSTRSKTWELYHEADVGREQYDYADTSPDSAYYGLFNEDDTTVTDYSSQAQKVFIGTKAGFRKFFRRGLIIDASSSYSYNIVQQDSFTEKYFQYADAALSLSSNTERMFSYGISATYSFLDYNKNDFKSSASIGYDFDKAGAIQLNASYSRIEPALLFNRFAFGNISWGNTFDKQSTLTAELSYRLPKYNIQAAVRFNQIKQLAFWDASRLPAQHSGSLHTWVFELHKLFRINYFGFDNVLRVQFVSDKNFLRYPVYWGVHSFFYERGVFKGKLLTRVGVDIRYNTNYKAPGYFPLTEQFYLQDEETLSFYPALDFYLLFKIKTVRLFMKMQHLNQGMFKDKGYFNAYKYPAWDRTFRFGVSWMFLD